MKKVYYILGLIASFKLGLAIGDIQIEELKKRISELEKHKEEKKETIKRLKEMIARYRIDFASKTRLIMGNQ